MKTIKKYLCDDTNYGWKHIMSFFLNNVLNIGDFVLLMQLKQSMTEGFVSSCGFFEALVI